MSKIRRSKLNKIVGLNRRNLRWFVFFGVTVFIFGVAFFAIPNFFKIKYELQQAAILATSTPLTPTNPVTEFVATHIPTPVPLKGIYMTSWVAGSKEIRSGLVKLIEATELNSVVIDIKDYSGRIAFEVDDPYLKEIGSVEKRVLDIREFVKSLHDKGIYVIGRISVFQDPYLVKLKPELAVRRKSDGEVWKDYKGISWLDAGSEEVWRYIAAIGVEAYKDGFDELNFDYIRFPSDGNMADIKYSFSNGKSKPEVLREFFAYLNKTLKPTGAVLSADLFGMTTTNTDDLNIGQVLENTLPYFDYVSPMVYPSHYPPNFMGFSKPAEKPYEVVKFAMDSAVRRTIASTTVVAIFGEQPISTSTKPFLYKKEVFSAQKIRPWLQDFNLGAVYTAAMVDKQIQAVYDSGLSSWMIWNAGNKYTKEALASAPITENN